MTDGSLKRDGKFGSFPGLFQLRRPFQWIVETCLKLHGVTTASEMCPGRQGMTGSQVRIGPAPDM